MQKLLRQTDEIVYCFDGDNAGRRAAWRALENSLGQLADGKQVRFLFLPQGEDPDSYVRQHGKEAFEKLLDDAMPLSQFLVSELSSRVDRSTSEGRARLLQEAKPLVKEITAPMLSLMLRKQLAELAGFTPQELDNEFQIKAAPRAAPASRRVRTQSSLALKVIELIAIDPSLARHVDRTQLASGFGLEVKGANQLELRALDRLLEVMGKAEQGLNIGEYFRETEFGEFFAKVEAGTLGWQQSGLNAEGFEAEFRDAWPQLQTRILSARRETLLEKPQQVWTAEERAEFLVLEQQLKAAKRK